jgi:hypothetical protein
MKIAWEYELPVREEPRDCDYEGPIFATESQILFATFAFAHPREARAKERSRRDYLVTMHSLDSASRSATRTEYKLPRCTIPSSWEFVESGSHLLLYCEPFLAVSPCPGDTGLPVVEVVAVKKAARPHFLLFNEHLIFAGGKLPRLYSVDLKRRRIAWELDLKGQKPYAVGPPFLLGGQIVCHGRDALQFIDPARGTVTDTLSLPRIDKLYSPLAVGDDLLIGYTNWQAGGVVRCSRAERKIVWKYRKNFSGPASYCRIWLLGDVVIWVKGETEIIGIDAATGSQRWSHAASPWLYSEIDLRDGDLIFGTAGRDGYLQRLDAATGKPKWVVFLKNGCQYYDYFRGSAIVGDFDGYLRRLDLADGRQLDAIRLDGQVVGDMRVSGAAAYTVVWFGADGRPPRLVRVDLQ